MSDAVIIVATVCIISAIYSVYKKLDNIYDLVAIGVTKACGINPQETIRILKGEQK